MQVGDFGKEYQVKTDDELLLLVEHSDQLTSEARTYLNAELVRRGIREACVTDSRESRAVPITSVVNGPQEISSIPLVPGKESQAIGPTLAAERPKPPWRPKVAGRIAFFFGPVAGAQVAAISLRRMGYREKAGKALRLAFAIAAAEGVVLFFLPDALTRLVGLIGEIVFLLTFPKLMENEFEDWQGANPDVSPSSGWNAIGWGILGILVFFVVAVAAMTVLAIVFGLLRIPTR